MAPNLLQRDFSASAPNQKWVGDILGVPTDEGWLYVAALLDTFSRCIIGLAMSAYRDEVLVMAALRMALTQRTLVGNLIHYTDRGSQYTTDDYLALLTAHGVTVSMSGKGDPYDNAMRELFQHPTRGMYRTLSLCLARNRAIGRLRVCQGTL